MQRPGHEVGLCESELEAAIRREKVTAQACAHVRRTIEGLALQQHAPATASTGSAFAMTGVDAARATPCRGAAAAESRDARELKRATCSATTRGVVDVGAGQPVGQERARAGDGVRAKKEDAAAATAAVVDGAVMRLACAATTAEGEPLMRSDERHAALASDVASAINAP